MKISLSGLGDGQILLLPLTLASLWSLDSLERSRHKPNHHTNDPRESLPEECACLCLVDRGIFAAASLHGCPPRQSCGLDEAALLGRATNARISNTVVPSSRIRRIRRLQGGCSAADSRSKALCQALSMNWSTY